MRNWLSVTSGKLAIPAAIGHVNDSKDKVAVSTWDGKHVISNSVVVPGNLAS